MEPLELQDIQGIIIYGYGKLAAARFLLLQVTEAIEARRWLKTIAKQLTSADTNPSKNRQDTAQTTCLNLAFTYEGLRALELGTQTLEQFPIEFQEGMSATAHRQRLLGDHGESAPESWHWGGPKTPEIHLLLMLYAIDDITLEAFDQTQQQGFLDSGLQLITTLETYRLPVRGEHFGFRDDIADPIIAGTHRQGPPENTISPGEFILGYPNGYGQHTNSPKIGDYDWGQNGSYLVFRQLSQDVKGFWQFLDQSTRNPDGSNNPQARLKLAAKMVGRWPGGAPLVSSPESDDPALALKNDFLYHATDPQGLKCPFGSHIRRVNPRDALAPDAGSPETLERVNRHRILRRGRPYGKPIADSMSPEDILAEADSGEERGLHFICFNANISRQFEFIQHTWVNNPKFDGLYQDDDPIIGDRGLDATNPSGTFTEQACPVSKRITSLPRFVQVRGGAYFFMPGINAIRFLGDL